MNLPSTNELAQVVRISIHPLHAGEWMDSFTIDHTYTLQTGVKLLRSGGCDTKASLSPMDKDQQ